MADPFDVPNIGTRPHLYRLLRDNMYHTAGTILCLLDEQAAPHTYERVRVESDDAEAVGKIVAEMTTLRSGMDALNAKMDEVLKRLAATDKSTGDMAGEIQSVTEAMKGLTFRVHELEGAGMKAAPLPTPPVQTKSG